MKVLQAEIKSDVCAEECLEINIIKQRKFNVSIVEYQKPKVKLIKETTICVSLLE